MKLYMFRADELSETCRVSCQNKFVNLVHIVGLIIKTSIVSFLVQTVPKGVNTLYDFLEAEL
jgi:hypothetical protein